MLLRTDDAVSRLRAVWLGPEEIRFPFDWTFIEWGIFVGAATVAIPVFGLTVAPLLIQPLTGPVLDLLPSTLLALGVAWLVRSRLAPFIDSDRPFRYLASNAAEALRLAVWAHGPADRAVVGAGVAGFVVPALLLGWLRALLIVLFVVVASRWVRDRVEGDERYWERTSERAGRQVEVPALEVGVPVEMEVWT